MLRRTLPFLIAVLAAGDALAADQIARPHTGSRELQVPRAGYGYRATVAAESEALISPPSMIPRTPLLPGSATLPGYYGRAFSYDYQGPYYGGEYTSYFVRLPYACGVTGYC